MAGADALIASHDAKFTYWFIRPPEADPGIRPDIVMPNFPSYPSNHSTLSMAMATVIGATFPAHADSLATQAKQAGISRIYAGIHYRFDVETGFALGRQVAAWALAHDVRTGDPFVLH